MKRSWLKRNGFNLEEELHSTNPDYIAYIPKTYKKRKSADTGNEHFLVFDGPDGNLMAVWTQSSTEGADNQRIAFSRSPDDGVTWEDPLIIAGPDPSKNRKKWKKKNRKRMASWGFPMVSKQGRVYVLFSEHQGIYDSFFHTSGIIKAIYSDDNGNTWSQPEPIPMPRSIYDNPDSSYPTNIIVYQKPLRLSKGKYYCGFTRWVSKKVRNRPPNRHWTSMESVVEFMRFENLDENPEPRNFEISYIMSNDAALRVGHKDDKNVSVVQEPSIVKLPDDRLFCVMRTTRGQPYFTLSSTNADCWSVPQPLCFKEGGKPMKHPLSPCPIYQLSDTEYFLLFHNHDGHYKKFTPLDTLYHRRPIYISKGKYSGNEHQPIEFEEPTFLMDHTGRGLGPKKRHDLAMYASFTQKNGQNVLWYPDRKFFLLGKKIEL